MCRGNKSLVDKVTTLQHHLEVGHAGKYRYWANGANFVSKLPGDIKRWKAAAEEATCMLEHDPREKPHSEQVIPYSDKLFHHAAIEWLVMTDQLIHALEHPQFKEMIDVASHATNVVRIPGQKATCTEIMHMFKNHLTSLKSELNVSVVLLFCSFLIVLQDPTIQGEVSLTCDVTRTGTLDRTGNWISLPGHASSFSRVL
ncbi:hypothetical protein F5148DRAFT_989057 [Russula earlei]|uniref:Uncharacterized protein n=1 Tax=Russula earlei TaxID=71964 RepID=A0ACC0TSA3_9AGAM|nr:hypothetical protein F5148DRAFT_989057 [Russula earlei]